ncbi:MAG: fumarylacetoacetate hydrolase family protein [Pseudomonadota bacterium]
MTRFVSFLRDGKPSFGIARTDGLVDLGERSGFVDLRDAIRGDALQTLAREFDGALTDLTLNDVDLLPTIPNPEKIICIGVNYANRNAEYRDNSADPDYPSVFMRSRESLVAHGDDLWDPPESEQLDYEGEIVLIVGKGGRRIARERAREHVAGTTLMNEGSVRDWLRHAKFNVTQGKNFERSGSLGPALVTSDELDPFDELELVTRVNGEERQRDVTSNLMFPFDYLIAYLSTFYRLQPGDVIATGTPNGAGARFDPPKYLRPQDRIEVEVAGIGCLSNAVISDPGAAA